MTKRPQDALLINCLFCWDSKTLVNQVSLPRISRPLRAVKADVIYESVWNLFGIPPGLQLLRLNGKLIESPEQSLSEVFGSEEIISNGLNFSSSNSPSNITEEENTTVGNNALSHRISPHWLVQISAQLLGGKGGFGTLLRGQKGSKRKTRNFDACRDLSGRRLRHSQAMERLTQWIEKRQRDDELVKALGGEVESSTLTEDSKKTQFRLKHFNDLDVLKLNKIDTKHSASNYLQEVSETLDQTALAVTKGLSKISTPSSALLRNKTLMDSDSSSSSSYSRCHSSYPTQKARENTRCTLPEASSNVSCILTNRYLIGAMNDSYDLDETASSDNDEHDPEKEHIHQLDPLLESISFQEGLRPSSIVPLKPIIVSKRSIVKENKTACAADHHLSSCSSSSSPPLPERVSTKALDAQGTEHQTEKTEELDIEL